MLRVGSVPQRGSRVPHNVRSYFLVQALKVESDFRVVICLFLGRWSLSLVMALVMFVKAGSPARERLDHLLPFRALRVRRACEPRLVLLLGRCEKNNYQTILIPAPSLFCLNSNRLLFLGGSIQNYADFFKRNQPAFHHFVQPRKNCLDVLGRFNHLDNDR
jgi:hypothetical protein